MRKVMRQTLLAAAFLFLTYTTTAMSSPWGENYFPNIPLITQDGKSVRFFR